MMFPHFRFPALAALLLSAVCVSLAAADPAEAEPPSPDVLVGKWQRPDGGYVIEVQSVDSAGTLQAGYFNPRPIRVAAARWRLGADQLQVRIDLNDRGYEGALYLLRYDPANDQLTGTYRPAGQDTFEVVFLRLDS